MKRVLLGGLVAGLVLNVVDYVLYGVLLAGDFEAALQALGRGPITSSAIGWFILLDFLYVIGTLVALVLLPLAAMAGAWRYREETTAGAVS